MNIVKISGTSKEQIDCLKNLNVSNETYKTGVEELETVTEYMKKFGIPENNFAIKLSIVRGHDYYTGTVYETFLDNHKNIGSICGGGRFDNLAEFYTKEKLPGVGMSIGLTRLFYQLKENNMLKKQNSTISKAIILPMDMSNLDYCIELSNNLRKNNIANIVYLENKKFKNKLQYAVKSNIKYAIFVGEDEIKQNVYTVKNLYDTTQNQVNFEDLLKILNQ